MSIDDVRGAAASRTPGRRRRGGGLLANALAAGVLMPLTLLTGCTGEGSSGGSPVAARQDIAETGRSRVRDGGTLRWAVENMPDTFNTFQADADSAGDRIAGAVLPALFTLDARGRPQRNEDYLQSADVVEREPKQVVVYKLNPKAKWTDGRALGALDFAAQWKALNGRDSSYWTARNAGYDRIQKVEPGADQHQVKVTFSKPYADWRSLFSPLYPRSVMGSPAAFNDGARKSLKATAGPFMLKRATNKDDKDDRNATSTVTLERNPHWWGDRAKLDKLVLTAVPRVQRTAALADGELDLADIDRSTFEKIEDAAGPRGGGGVGEKRADGKAGQRAASTEVALRGYTVRKSLEPAYTQLALNGESGALSDDRVRRALARALDRQAIADAVLKPLGLPSKPLGSHLVMAGQRGYEDHSSALGSQDAEAAQALLADAGWRPGTGTRPKPAGTKADAEGETKAGTKADTKADAEGDTEGEGNAAEGAPKPNGPEAERGEKGRQAGTTVVSKDGKPLSLRFVLPTGPGTESLRAVGDRVAGMLDAIGVRTEIVKVADNSYFKDHIASGGYDLALYSWPASAYPATDGRPIFAKPQPGNDGSLVVEQNYTRVGTDQIDQLFDQAVTELDAGASRALMARADARIWAAAGSIPLFQRPQLVAAKSDLVNAGAFGFATPRYQDIGFRR